jgi:threonine/homoserine/homoserine lactone efflux protein
MITALLLGFGLSFIGSAPMTGPLALLVLDRVIAAQRASAFWIACAGALVEGIVALGIATFLPLVLQHSSNIVLIARVSGAIVIFAIGLALLLRPSLLLALKTERKRESFVAGFLATALNPTLLATWTVTVTALHSSGLLAGGYVTGPIFGIGVALGALAWFIVILLLSRHWSSQRMGKYRGALARAIGLILVVVGVGLFIRAVL